MDRKWVFRGWDAVGNKGWVYGDLVHNKRVDLTDRVMVGGYEVVPESVGLWTGLKDKNENKVFEGDIVRKRDLTFKTELVGVVVYNSEIGCFRIHSENNGITMLTGFESSDFYDDGKCTVPIKYDYEVISNIYQNKELLKK